MSHNTNHEPDLKMYKDLDVLRNPTIKNSVYFVYSSASQKVTQIWVTTNQNVPKQVELSAPVSLKTIASPNGTIEVVETSTEIQLELEASILALINSSLQAGDNVSSLINDAGYITISDVPPFDPSDYDLEEFNNNGADPYAHQSEITSGVTNLSYTASPTQGTVNSDTGTGATIPLADVTNAGLLTPAEKAEIASALQPGDITQYTDEQAQDAVGAILLDTTTIDLSYNDVTPSISADVKPNSITATELSDNINISEFVNDSGYSTVSYVDGKVIDSIIDGDTTNAPSRNSVFDALALKGDMDTTTAQTVSGIKTFLSGTIGFRNTANTFTSFITNTNTASRTYTVLNEDGALAMDTKVMHLAGNETFTGTKTFTVIALATPAITITNNLTGTTSYGFIINNTSTGTGTGLRINNSSTVGNGIQIQNNNGARGIDIINSSTGRGIYITNSSVAKGMQIDNTSTGVGLYIVASGSGMGLQIDASGTQGGLIINSSSASPGITCNSTGTSVPININHSSNSFAVRIDNNSSGTAVKINNIVSGSKGVIIDNATAVTSKPFSYTKNLIEKAYLDDAGKFSAQIVNLTAYTVATLPTGTLGDTACVTDALTPTYLGIATGGGTVRCKVFHNGTNWIT